MFGFYRITKTSPRQKTSLGVHPPYPGYDFIKNLQYTITCSHPPNRV